MREAKSSCTVLVRARVCVEQIGFAGDYGIWEEETVMMMMLARQAYTIAQLFVLFEFAGWRIWVVGF